jgi:hypothetical protein
MSAANIGPCISLHIYLQKICKCIVVEYKVTWQPCVKSLYCVVFCLITINDEPFWEGGEGVSCDHVELTECLQAG